MESTDFNSLLNFLTSYGHNLVGVSQNLVDRVWGDERPILNLTRLEPLPISFSGIYKLIIISNTIIYPNIYYI